MTIKVLLCLSLALGACASAQGVTSIPATPIGAPTPSTTTNASDPVYPSGFRLSQLQAASAALQGLPGLTAKEIDPAQGRLRVTVGTAVERVAVLQRLREAGLSSSLVTFTASGAASNLPGATGTVTTTPGTGTAPSTPTTPTSAGGRVTVTELASGTNANVATAAVQVATSQAALNALYTLAYGRQTGTPAVPTLRSGETVVGVFLGQRPTGGYGVRATGASVQGDTLTLTVEVRTPGPGAITTQALTSPWTLVRVSGTFRSVRVVDASGRPLQSGAGGGQTR
ncbi:protease complex subunit PrcB family protein [Deinococcus apachensis]|uniref:protease complex subunit PrcB family protein n=1 Tax=Deinococcus apachensis TaxID=309886 RepID=UPI000373FC07|nr:protease complex subunit PrcB family protein [Deinococcus apachensis]